MAVERTNPPRIIEFRPVRLWLDDLHDVCNIIGSNGKYAVDIEAEGLKSQTLDELVAALRDPTITTLEISRAGDYASPGITLEIRSHAVRVIISRPDDEALGVLQQLMDLLRARRRKVTGKVPGLVVWGLLPHVIALPVALAVGYMVSDIVGRDVTTLVFLPAYMALLVAAWKPTIRADSPVVHTTRRADSPSLWQRTKDQIVVNAVGSVVGVVVGAVLGFILGRNV